MKHFYLFFVIFFLVPSGYSQDAQKAMNLSSLSLSSGQGPLSSGIFFEANFLRGNDFINVSIGERDMYLVYLKGIGSRFSIGPSVEWYYNIPLLGVMANTTPLKLGKFSLGTMTWGGISAGNPGEQVDLLGWRWLFFWQSLDISYARFSATAAVLSFDGTWGNLVDFKYKQPFTEHFSIFASAGYSWFVPEQALLKLGLVYYPGGSHLL